MSVSSEQATLVATVAFCLGLTAGLVLGWFRGYAMRGKEQR
jgi:hypothetical protein